MVNRRKNQKPHRIPEECGVVRLGEGYVLERLWWLFFGNQLHPAFQPLGRKKSRMFEIHIPDKNSTCAGNKKITPPKGIWFQTWLFWVSILNFYGREATQKMFRKKICKNHPGISTLKHPIWSTSASWPRSSTWRSCPSSRVSSCWSFSEFHRTHVLGSWVGKLLRLGGVALDVLEVLV